MSSGADQMGYWAKNTCGSSYFFSNALASFIEKMFHVLFYLSDPIITGYVGAKLSKMLQLGFDAHSV
jgi:hypothetical protein